jgi:hypothetical protein
MIPVALGWGEGAEFRAPLGRAVIGGVITSTLLTLVVIPTFYEIMDEWREKVMDKVGLGKHRAAHPVTGGVTPFGRSDELGEELTGSLVRDVPLSLELLFRVKLF